MTKFLDDPNPLKMSAAERAARIERTFTSICIELDEMIANFGSPDGTSPKAMNLKLSELQSAHVSLIKAHEVFCEKFEITSDDSTDYNAIRDDIGRKLDRIRAALDAG